MNVLFNGGDEVRQPFRVMSAGEVVNLTGCTISAILRAPYYVDRELTVENGGLVLQSLNPSGGNPHGLVVLDEEMTETLFPSTPYPSVRIVVVDSSGITMSTSKLQLVRQD